MIGFGYERKRKTNNKDDFTINNLEQEDIDRIMNNLPIDESRPADAFELSQNDIRRELIDRGVKPKGFFNDDASRLQEEFNTEHIHAQDERKEAIIQKGKQGMAQM